MLATHQYEVVDFVYIRHVAPSCDWFLLPLVDKKSCSGWPWYQTLLPGRWPARPEKPMGLWPGTEGGSSLKQHVCDGSGPNDWLWGIQAFCTIIALTPNQYTALRTAYYIKKWPGASNWTEAAPWPLIDRWKRWDGRAWWGRWAWTRISKHSFDFTILGYIPMAALI